MIDKRILLNSARAFVATLQERLKLPISKELEKGRIRSSQSCPIAKSLQLEGYVTYTSNRYITFFRNWDSGPATNSTYCFDVPEAVGEFIKAIDSGLFPELTKESL